MEGKGCIEIGMMLPRPNSLTQGYVSRLHLCFFYSFTYWFVVVQDGEPQ